MRRDPPQNLPYPKLKLRANFCECKEKRYNQLRVGAPLPPDLINRCTREANFPKPRPNELRKSNDYGDVDERKRSMYWRKPDHIKDKYDWRTPYDCRRSENTKYRDVPWHRRDSETRHHSQDRHNPWHRRHSSFRRDSCNDDWKEACCCKRPDDKYHYR